MSGKWGYDLKSQQSLVRHIKKTLFFLLIISPLSIDLLQSEIILRRIVNESKKQKVEITYPWSFGYLPLKIKSKKLCVLEFGSKEKPVVYIDKQLTEETPLIISITDNIYELYYGENKALQPCICIKRSDGIIYRDARTDTKQDPFVSLIITDDPKKFPQLIILEELEFRSISRRQA